MYIFCEAQSPGAGRVGVGQQHRVVMQSPVASHQICCIHTYILLVHVTYVTVNFSTFRVARTGNICLGKCCVLHCSLWGVQTIHFPIRIMQCSNATEINCSYFQTVSYVWLLDHCVTLCHTCRTLFIF